MDLLLQAKPRFSVGRELATSIASCGILHRAWDEIRDVSKNDEIFSLKEFEGVAYVTFPSFSKEDFILTNSKYGEYNILNEVVFSVCLKGNDECPAIVLKGALSRFKYILESSDFLDKIRMLTAKTVIFVGHSTGGAVATLFTLWFLQKKARDMSYFCITFGSPLVGNDILGEAIRREDWAGKFCHVVSKYDIVPRALLAPFESITKLLHELEPHWRSRMGTDSVVVTHPSVPKAHNTLLKEVLQFTSKIADKSGESAPTSPYRPFGTYMFCSTQGAACIEDSEAVLKMLHFTMQGIPFDQLAGTCASDHTGYGQMLEAVTDALLNATPIANFATDSFEMGIVRELEAMAVGSQERSDAYSALKQAGEAKLTQDTNNEKLNEELSKMQSHMAEVEWYKSRCKKDSGYYDSFKVKTDVERRENHINMAREKLDRFWDEIVEKEENHVLPSDFRWQNKWINAGTAYRRLVEPLDIKFYHCTRVDNKSYLSVGVRHHRHIVLEKWMKEKDQSRIQSKKKKRTKLASLTIDSCFWAHLDEACQALKSLPRGDVVTPSLQKSREFEDYLWKMIQEKSISEEVFLKGSSFMKWWEEYSHYLQRRFPQYMSSNSTAGIHNFIENEGWKQNNGPSSTLGNDPSK